jgi:transcriptional regulator of acetoin/glycerol metabolism
MLTDGDRVCVADLPGYLWEGEIAAAAQPEDQFEPENDAAGAADRRPRYSLDEVINKASKTALMRALRETGGNCHRAAQLLGVSRYTVYRMIARYGLAAQRARQNPGLRALSGLKPT